MAGAQCFKKNCIVQIKDNKDNKCVKDVIKVIIDYPGPKNMHIKKGCRRDDCYRCVNEESNKYCLCGNATVTVDCNNTPFSLVPGVETRSLGSKKRVYKSIFKGKHRVASKFCNGNRTILLYYGDKVMAIINVIAANVNFKAKHEQCLKEYATRMRRTQST